MKNSRFKIIQYTALLACVVIGLSSCSIGNTNYGKVSTTSADNTTTTSTTQSTSQSTSTESSTESTVTTTTTSSKPTAATSKYTTATTSKKSTITPQSSVSANGKEIVTKSNGLTYVDGILIANKTYGLPSSYSPGVNSEASSALDKMFAAAKKDGITLTIVSGYRSYSLQSRLYNNYVSRDGKAAADRYSARPGNSEHQTGLAFDLNSLSQSFENTPEGKWIAKNCYKYGFILRYPKGKESKTGYMYEPWHVRYLGVSYATKVYNSGLCLEEYLGITSTYN